MAPSRDLYSHAQLLPLFEPRSIAVIDFSSKRTSFGVRTWNGLSEADIPVYLVNPKLKEEPGRKIHSTIERLPQTVDCAIIAVPRDATASVATACAEAGIRAAIVYASGYAETGKDEYRQMQETLTQLSARTGMRILGPNCMGIVTARGRLPMTFAEAPPLGPTREGSIGLVSQSGGLGFALAQAARHGCSFSHVLTAGNSCDVDVADEIAYLAHDPESKVVACLFEGMPNPLRMVAAGQVARRAGKPVVVCKLGTGDEGSQAAMSHTGSLAGSSKVYAAAFAKAGFVVVDDLEALIETAAFFAKAGQPSARGVAALATSGGATIIVADKAERHGVALPQPSSHVSAILRSHIPEFGSTRNPCDVTAQILNNPQAMPACATAMLQDEAYGALVIPHPYAFEAGAFRLQALGEVASLSDKPICCVWLSQWLDGPGAREVEEHRRMCLFRSMERCMRTLRSWFDWQDSMQADNAFAPRCSPQAASAEARTILESAGRVLTEGPAKRLLAAYGVPVVAEEVALDEKSACDAARRLGFPVALKVESLDVPHKTEAGGVRLDLRSEEDVRSAYAAIVRNIRNAIPHARLGGMLVQSMVRRDVEIIIGGKCDPLFGPTVLVGFGGVFVELLKDTVVALAPVSVDEALTMLASLRGHALLKGFRGTPATDELELARIVARVSELIAEQADRIEEIDVNPLVISNGRAIAVDALASLRSREDVGS